MTDAVQPEPQPLPPATEEVSSGSDGADADEELVRLRGERDALAAQFGRRDRRHRWGQTFRRTTAALLVVVFALLLPLSTALTWGHRTIFNTDRYVATVAPLGSNPTVTSAVAAQLTDQIYTALDPESTIKTALPPKAAFLAGPIAGQVKNFLGDGMNKVLTSPQFAEIWTNANRRAQAQLVAVLKGKSAAVQEQGDTVVLNLVPLINAALQSVQPQVSGIVGKNVTLPTISGDELPAVACQKISTALSRPVPQTCGQIPLFPTSKLDAVQKSVTRFDRLTVLSLVLLPVLFVGALAVSPRRRRTLLQLTIGGALTVVLLRRAVFYLDDRLTSAAKPENRAAAHVIVSTLLDRLVTITVWILVGALVLAVLALLTGPYRWARAVRHGAAVAGEAVGTTTVQVGRGMAGVAGDDDTRRWVGVHRGSLQASGAVLAGFLLLVLNLSLWGVLVLAVLLAGYELGVVRLAALGPADGLGEVEDRAGDQTGNEDGDAVPAATAPRQREAEDASPAVIDLTETERVSSGRSGADPLPRDPAP